MTTPDRQGDHPNLHRGHHGKSAESRARSLAGLTPGHVKHGANVRSIVAPIERRERRRLRRAFPQGSKVAEGVEIVRACAARAALIERYVGRVGDARAGQKADASAAMAGRLLAAQERAIKRLAALEREAETVAPNDQLRAIEREYATRREGDDQGEEGDGRDDD